MAAGKEWYRETRGRVEERKGLRREREGENSNSTSALSSLPDQRELHFKKRQVIQSPINNSKCCCTYYCVNVSPGIYPWVSGIKFLGSQGQCLCDQEYLDVTKYTAKGLHSSPYCCCRGGHWQTRELVGSWWIRLAGRECVSCYVCSSGWPQAWPSRVDVCHHSLIGKYLATKTLRHRSEKVL